MNKSSYSRFFFKISSSTVALILLSLTSCATYLGSTIEVPEIPAPAESGAGSRGRLNAALTVSGFKDVRDSVVGSGAEDTEYTEPFGNATGEVEKAVKEALRQKGIANNGGKLNLWGEIRRWRSHTKTTTTNTIESEASLYVELLDLSGKRLYSGTFQGSRSSITPLAKSSDIKSSLGSAMSQAIDQMLQDEEFLGAILNNSY